MAQWVNDPALPQLGHRPGKFHMLWVWPLKKINNRGECWLIFQMDGAI